jgi:hypothetical protein
MKGCPEQAGHKLGLGAPTVVMEFHSARTEDFIQPMGREFAWLSSP